MNDQQRMNLINHQHRSFLEGTVENINHQWVFFDNETDEATSLEEYANLDIDIYRRKNWYRGIIEENGFVKIYNDMVHLYDGETVKIRKPLLGSFERLLKKIETESFVQFITSLNSLDFSIHDCIYCYNQLDFSEGASPKTGVNFLVFDNELSVCSVQHHFFYTSTNHDRFEFTINTGKRIIIEKINSKHS
ncbi:DUF2777 family protein [Peribacillus huizhouensis]|uniref:DUF2777 domain-containing protein n=1 Tax=Peribacillus huizhouensis TaxID=1501239 RepID=A0ABR6CJY8_9BACI|nr:DUF2777 family protein [Peribacillus huizhouensis]MBA9025226.1 hypothetical protein [Peribacillus huizhouensis]